MLDIGTELAERYRVDSWLGRSPLGNIYLGEDLEQHRPVAIKELRRDLAADPKFVWGLRNEAQILNQTPQPGALRPEDVVEANGGAFVVVDYEPGMGLEELEERWPRTGYFARAWDNAPPPAEVGESVGLIGQPEPVAPVSPVRAAWPRPSATALGVLLLTALVALLVIAAWLRGPGLFGQDPGVRAAPGVSLTGTGTAPASATPGGAGSAQETGAPQVALTPLANSSPTPSQTGTEATAGLALTDVPPATSEPTQTPAATSTQLLPTSTPTAATAYALIQAPANVRQGPGPNYTVLTVLQPGDRAAITERSQDGGWWQVRTADGQTGWIFTSLVTAEGPLDQVPVAAAPTPAAPTEAAPSATATSSLSPTVGPSATVTPAPTETPAPTVTPSPTETPSPAPTATEEATAVAAPTDTATPTSSTSPGACSEGPTGPFAELPLGPERLGCPIGGPSSTDFAHQVFQGGQMLYRHDLRTVYVLYNDGTWTAFHDNYVEGEPFQLREYLPPRGLKQPIKGFDRVWEQRPVRARLGWAIRDEASVITGQAQAFERSQVMWVNRQGYLTAFFVLFADGTWAEYH